MYGVLKSISNTGSDAELQYIFAAPLSVISNQPAVVQDTLNLRRKTSSQNVQRWEVEADILPTNGSSDFLVHSVMNGYNNIIYLRMPQVYRPAGSKLAAGHILRVGANVSANGTIISVLDNGVAAKFLQSGEFISFAGDAKVYLVVNGDTANIQIYPPLLSSKVVNTLITYGDSVTMQARYDNDTMLGIKYSDGILSDQGSVKFIEAL